MRFEPGEAKDVVLIEFGGTGELLGLNGLTDGNCAQRGDQDGSAAQARASAASREHEPMAKMSRKDYAAMYGPTTGDAVRLGDTSLLAEVEHDFAVPRRRMPAWRRQDAA